MTTTRKTSSFSAGSILSHQLDHHDSSTRLPANNSAMYNVLRRSVPSDLHRDESPPTRSTDGKKGESSHVCRDTAKVSLEHGSRIHEILRLMVRQGDGPMEQRSTDEEGSDHEKKEERSKK